MRARWAGEGAGLQARHQRQSQPMVERSGRPPKRTGECSRQRCEITLPGMPGADQGET